MDYQAFYGEVFEAFSIINDVLQRANLYYWWQIGLVILALSLGCVSYVFIINKPQNGYYNEVVLWLIRFFKFEKSYLRMILEFWYLIGVIYLGLVALVIPFISHGIRVDRGLKECLFLLIMGNLILRLVYELLICLVNIELKLSKISSLSIKDNDLELNNEKVVFCRNCGNEFNVNEKCCPFCGGKNQNYS